MKNLELSGWIGGFFCEGGVKNTLPGDVDRVIIPAPLHRARL